MTTIAESSRKAVIVGAGPVGCLTAISLAKMGWAVDVYEGRPDMRLPSSKQAAQLRSINLTISSRGIAAIQAIQPSAADRFVKAGIPMRGRMIHHIHGAQESLLYDKDEQCINSIGRSFMNEDLLIEALAIPTIRVFFKHKVISIDFDHKSMTVHDTDAGKDKEISFDFCVGADGSYSIVRRQLMRVVLMDYQQEYIPHEYLELKMSAGPAADNGGDPTFLLDPNHLHIWPRHTFMLIALPNKDRTFTCTLFAPTQDFQRLDTPGAFLQFFKNSFPDALSLIGEQALLDDFKRNPRSPLMSIKARPYHYRDRAVILGDAAHAIVPFYGQGLNCGLEDVRILDILLRAEGVDPTISISQDEDSRLAKALARYSESRHDDLVAICELAMDNYVEMRHGVITPAYLFRKTLDNILYSLTSKAVTLNSLSPILSRELFPTVSPTGWLPLYTMVTFRPDMSYSTVRRVASRERKMLEYARWVTTVIGIGAAGVMGITAWRRLCNRG